MCHNPLNVKLVKLLFIYSTIQIKLEMHALNKIPYNDLNESIMFEKQ